MRPEIFALSVDTLPWEVLGNNGLRRKLLSRDPATGAVTMYVNIPRGWRGGGVAHYHEGFEEVFVIKGDVTLNGRDYLSDRSYLYRPAGVVHGHAEGAYLGCYCLIRTGAQLELNLVWQPTEPQEYVLFPSDDGRPLIVELKTAAMEWADVGSGAGRYGRKLLSRDSRTGAETALLRLPAGWRGGLDLDAERAREWFVLSGEITFADGAVGRGNVYGHRHPGAAASITGATGDIELLVWQ